MAVDTSDFTFCQLNRAHMAQLNAINRACPIEADFTLVFERGDDFFRWPDLIYDSYQYIGAFCNGELVGYLMVGLFTGWTGEAFGMCGYLGDARVLPEFRGRHLTEQMICAIEMIVPPEVRLGLFLIKKGNLPAEAVAYSAHSAGYEVRALGDLHVVNIPLLKPAPVPSPVTVRHPQLGDLNAMAELFSRANQGKLFAPLMTADRLREDLARLPQLELNHYWVAEYRGRLIGMLAAWDMHPFHYTSLLRYSFQGRVLRTAYNLVTRLSPGSTPLPKAGGNLRTLTLTHTAIEDQDPSILQAMLTSVIGANLNKGYHLLNMGLIENDPMLHAVQEFHFVQHFVSSLHGITPRSRDFETKGNAVYLDLAMI